MKIIIQIIGIAAMIGSVYSFQLNKRKHIMIAQIIATSLFGIQYYLLGTFTGVALDTVRVARDIVFYNKDKVGVKQYMDCNIRAYDGCRGNSDISELYVTVYDYGNGLKHDFFFIYKTQNGKTNNFNCVAVFACV